ncbi:MAG: hypothetical protein QOD45_280 [Pseudonocardiales bacterium]|nr:hypothetical protein [Pseudonocardiales bacterium]
MSLAVRWSALVIGCVFGFLLTVSSLGDYSTVHEGLLLRNPYIFLMMGNAMSVALLRLAAPAPRAHCLFRSAGAAAPSRRAAAHLRRDRVRAPLRRRCHLPGMTIVMTTTGGLYGLVVLVGLLGELWLRGWVERRQQRPLSTEPTAPPLIAAASTSA